MGDQLPSTGLKPADFASSQEVRWCPGCGDYAILKAVRKTMADVGASLENTLVISGHWLRRALPLLYGDLWISYHSRTRPDHRLWCHAGQS